MAIILTNWVGERGLPSAIDVLTKENNALNAIEAGMRVVEADPDIPFVGRGGLPNSDGIMQFDAAVMEGSSRKLGAVAGLSSTPHAFSVAKQVMENLPHVLLVGEGADKFAMEAGFSKESSLTEKAENAWKQWKEQVKGSTFPDRFWPDQRNPHTKDTVVYIVVDDQSNFFVGTSTSGWSFKFPGRVGDSPVCGAGFYADSRYGACVCTCTGEMSIRAGTSRAAIAWLSKGASAEEAAHECIEDLMSITHGFTGDVCVHLVDKKGNVSVKMSGGSEPPYCLWQTGFSEYQKVEIV